MITKGNMCQVCQESASKYKCPICIIRFCSVPCYKSHKDELCVKPDVVQQEKLPTTELSYEFETEDTVPLEKLQLLGKDKDVLGTLNNKHLRDMLHHLNSQRNPSQAIETAMQEPIFLEFVTECLKVVEGTESSIKNSHMFYK